MAFGNLDQNGVVRPFRIVIFPKLMSQTVDLNPHNRVCFRIEIRLTSKNLSAYGVFLDAIGASFKCFSS